MYRPGPSEADAAFARAQNVREARERSKGLFRQAAGFAPQRQEQAQQEQPKSPRLMRTLRKWMPRTFNQALVYFFSGLLVYYLLHAMLAKGSPVVPPVEESEKVYEPK